MPKMQTCITRTAVQIEELCYESITRSFLMDECQITEFFSGYIVNFTKIIVPHRQSNSRLNNAFKLCPKRDFENNVPDFRKRILFSDEAHFWLNGYVNKQNCRIWSEANPQVYVETPLHPEKLTAWCALWAGGILLQKR
ncbi:hypothetical protein TNCV_881601 [Trichonephila clavipes]|nr:hypothetical protein TNCV_881601 [Trichonephila clavipes]